MKRAITSLEDKLLGAFKQARSMNNCSESDEEKEFWRRCYLSIKEAIAYMDLAHREYVNRDWKNL